MEFDSLRAALTPKGTIVTIGTDTFPAPFSDFVARYFFDEGKTIQIDSAEVMPDAASRTVKIAGRANFLKASNAPVRAVFSLDDKGDLDAVLTYTLLDRGGTLKTWTFTTSFPDLVDQEAADAGHMDEARPLLDKLTFTEAYFVVSSSAHTDPDTGAELGPGISFLGKMRPKGVVSVLDGLLADSPTLPIYGSIRIPVDASDVVLPNLDEDFGAAKQYPWERNPALPGIDLMAPIGASLSLGKLEIGDARLRFWSPLSFDWYQADEIFAPCMALTGRMSIPSAGLSVDIIATEIPPVGTGVSRSPATLFVEARCQGFSIAHLSHLSDVTGSGDLGAELPDKSSGFTGALEQISLEDLTFSISAGTGGLELDSVSVTIGAPQCNWKMFGGRIDVTSIGVLFEVLSPLGSRRVSVKLFGETVIEGAHIDLEAMKYTGGFLVSARSKDKERLPLQRLLKSYAPLLPAPSDLTIDELRVTLDERRIRFTGSLAEEPDAWKIQLGPAKLAIENVSFDFFVPRTGKPSGMFRGDLAFGKDVTISILRTIPGDFVVKTVCDELSLSHAIATLSNQKAPLPAGFDLTLRDSSILIEEHDERFTFQLATRVEGFGYFAFEAKQVASGWGFAFGLDLAGESSSKLPGLSALAAFEKALHLEKFMLVVSTYDDAGFQFPDLSAMQVGAASGHSKLTLPSQASGVRAGLDLFAEWQLSSKDKTQNLLSKLLGLGGTLGVTIQIGDGQARLFVERDAMIHGHRLSCQVGMASSFGPGVVPSPSFFLTGYLTLNIQGTPQTFNLSTAFVPTGAFLSASVTGSAPIDCKWFKLANLALEIGVDWAGIPSFGVACTLDIGTFESSLAVFFDSADPTRSLVAGSFGELTLKDIVDGLLGHHLPSSIDAVLAKAGVFGTHRFEIDKSVATSLDHRDIAAISAAFSAAKVQIPSSTDQVFLSVQKPGNAWHLTDLSIMRHYSLALQGGKIEVSVDPQFYFAPEPTSIGAIRFPQGFYLNGAVDVFGFRAAATIDISPQKGILVDAEMDRIVIGNEHVFSITSADGKTGPKVSIATFSQPEQKDPHLRSPHFYVSGRLALLGLEDSVLASVGTSGVTLDLKGALAPGAEFDLDVTFGGKNLEVDGDIKVGVGKIDLGPLGKIHIDTDVEGSLGIRVDGHGIRVAAQASFEFLGDEMKIGRFSIEPHPKALAGLAKTIEEKVLHLLQDLFKDADRWAHALEHGVVEGVADTEKVLKDVYKKSEKEAKEMAHTIDKGLAAAGKGIATAGKDVGKGVATAGKDVGKGVASAGKDVGKGVASAGKDVGKGVASAGKSVAKFGKKLGKLF